MLPTFQAIDLESFLTLDKPICPRFVAEFYHSLEIKRDEEERPYIEFKLGEFTFELDTSQHSRIFQTLKALETFYTIKNKSNGPMPFAMLLTCLYNHILRTNPQAVVPPNRFTFHDRVMNPLDFLRNPFKEKGKRVAYPSISSSLSSSSDKNEAPSFLEFYDKLSDNEDLTDSQREKRGMFKCLNRYFGTITKYLKNQK
ncbi:hypothetical protein Tco_0857324 [Tanacetum coccineum]|uniref:Uncharacterized protein n=1 Tax=Tanacetum coccineum TaxID=301880 RepID=A0ABQ5B8P0_9ASTR